MENCFCRFLQYMGQMEVESQTYWRQCIRWLQKVLRPLYATGDKEERIFLQKRLLIEPFAFSKETKSQPIEFEIFFRTEIAEYRYKLHIMKDVVNYESLDRVN